MGPACARNCNAEAMVRDTNACKEPSRLILEAIELSKIYEGGETPVQALRNASLKLDRGDFVAVMGPSGCGKSSLLHLCGAMDRPTSGSIAIEGTPLQALDDLGLTRLRRSRIGFVFQFFNLLPTLTIAKTWLCHYCWRGFLEPKPSVKHTDGSIAWVLRAVAGTFPISSLEARCSAQGWLWGSPTGLLLCLPMNPPVIWIQPTAFEFWNCCVS